ncbi:MAG TPA: HAMP domain-containing sensor histidine kinase [Candidatus Dormibacteraeota bacterium]|nr:HAMP domain-containing sensor histidine kinase [Candidatus Dormibacteraeota bacterium]
MSLRSRLALFGAGVVALALLIFGLLLYVLLSRGVDTSQDGALRTRAQQAVASLNAAPQLSTPASVVPADLRSDTGVFVEAFDPTWRLLYTTGEPAITPATHATGFVTQGGFRLYATRFSGGYVVTGQSTKVPQSSLSGIVVFLVVSAIPALIAALLASWLVAGRALRPLKAVASTAEDIGRMRDFGRRLPPQTSRDDVARLTASFNGMLTRLQEAFESQRRFVADASHELRTPLTTIQGNAGLLASRDIATDVQRAAIADVVHESARMSRLVDRLLTLARADAGLELQLVPVDLRAVVEEVCRQTGKSVDLEAVAARVEGDEDALRQLLWILLDNAFRYSSARVAVRLASDQGWARLTVADDGPGIPLEQRAKIFERFYRADTSRTGSHAGLGLSIASWIVTQHHGRILAGEAAIGGAAFLVDLPLLPDS